MNAVDGLQTIDLSAVLAQRGVSRRRFLKYCATMAGVLALPPRFALEIASGLQTAKRVPVIWLEAQDCAGNSEAFLRAEKPTISQLLLDSLSVDYHHLIMAPSGAATDKSIEDTMKAFPNGYIAIVEGSIPLADGGVYCTIGGRTFAEMARDICKGAAAVVAVGSCAWDGGIPAARGGVTGAVGVSGWLNDSSLKVINLPGCPMNPDNLAALIIQYLALKRLPDTDKLGRPLFAYGDTVHETCESLPHYRQKRFVKAWGDEGHRLGWCLYQMGCRGPSTYANCSTLKFNGGVSWPVASGHGCVGCTQPRFWDASTPLYVVGALKDVPTPTPVAYQTPVPGATASGGVATPPGGDGRSDGGGDDDSGTNLPLMVGAGAVAVAVLGAAGAFAVTRARRDSGSAGASPEPSEPGTGSGADKGEQP